MSEKRMFSKSIVLSDAFLDMPASSRCLYFTLNMLADDDGFVDSPKSVMRQSGATEDDLKVLLAKFFLIPFENGIVVIRHWRINNYLRCDRYKETRYLEEKSQLIVNADSSYTKIEAAPKRAEQQTARPRLLEREPVNDLEKIEKLYLQNYERLYKKGILKSETPIINWSASRKLTNEVIKKYGLEVILGAVKKSVSNQFCVSRGYSLTTILSAGVLAGLINENNGYSIANDAVSIEEVNF